MQNARLSRNMSDQLSVLCRRGPDNESSSYTTLQSDSWMVWRQNIEWSNGCVSIQSTIESVLLAGLYNLSYNNSKGRDCGRVRDTSRRFCAVSDHRKAIDSVISPSNSSDSSALHFYSVQQYTPLLQCTLHPHHVIGRPPTHRLYREVLIKHIFFH